MVSRIHWKKNRIILCNCYSTDGREIHKYHCVNITFSHIESKRIALYFRRAITFSISTISTGLNAENLLYVFLVFTYISENVACILFVSRTCACLFVNVIPKRLDSQTRARFDSRLRQDDDKIGLWWDEMCYKRVYSQTKEWTCRRSNKLKKQLIITCLTGQIIN